MQRKRRSRREKNSTDEMKFLILKLITYFFILKTCATHVVHFNIHNAPTKSESDFFSVHLGKFKLIL